MNIPQGSSIIVGSVKNQMGAKLARSIAEIAASFPDIQEAYLFGCFVTGMSKPAEVLVLVFSASCDFTGTVARVSRKVSPLIPGTDLDVWPLTPDNSILRSVRLGRTLFVRSPAGEPILAEAPEEKKRWWQIW
jgi:hypothetical protein